MMPYMPAVEVLCDIAVHCVLLLSEQPRAEVHVQMANLKPKGAVFSFLLFEQE